MSFSTALMHTAARLYYLEDATQAEIAARLGVSRPTVSRLLSEARRAGIVRIEVVAPMEEDGAELEDELAGGARAAPGLHLAPPAEGTLGEALAPALSDALRGARLPRRRPARLVRADDLGGRADGAAPPPRGRRSHRRSAARTRRRSGTRRTRSRGSWPRASGARRRSSTPPRSPASTSTRRCSRIPRRARSSSCGRRRLRDPRRRRPPLTRARGSRASSPRGAATSASRSGDICSRFYDARGDPVPFPGTERLIATGLERLREIPVAIALAAGAVKVPSIVTGAASGYFNQLVTDAETARALLVARAAAAEADRDGDDDDAERSERGPGVPVVADVPAGEDG